MTRLHLILILSVLAIYHVTAQSTDYSSASLPTSFDNPSTVITNRSENVISYINRFLIVTLFAGLLYIVGSLVMSNQVNRAAITAWGVCFIIWGIAQLIIGTGINS